MESDRTMEWTKTIAHLRSSNDALAEAVEQACVVLKHHAAEAAREAARIDEMASTMERTRSRQVQDYRARLEEKYAVLELSLSQADAITAQQTAKVIQLGVQLSDALALAASRTDQIDALGSQLSAARDRIAALESDLDLTRRAGVADGMAFEREWTCKVLGLPCTLNDYKAHEVRLQEAASAARLATRKAAQMLEAARLFRGERDRLRTENGQLRAELEAAKSHASRCEREERSAEDEEKGIEEIVQSLMNRMPNPDLRVLGQSFSPAIADAINKRAQQLLEEQKSPYHPDCRKNGCIKGADNTCERDGCSRLAHASPAPPSSPAAISVIFARMPMVSPWTGEELAMQIRLSDGRTLLVGEPWIPKKLAEAPFSAKMNYQLVGTGETIVWPDLDVRILVADLIWPRGIARRRRGCSLTCRCLCHDSQGAVHDHPGRPCPGKTG